MSTIAACSSALVTVTNRGPNLAPYPPIRPPVQVGLIPPLDSNGNTQVYIVNANPQPWTVPAGFDQYTITAVAPTGTPYTSGLCAPPVPGTPVKIVVCPIQGQIWNGSACVPAISSTPPKSSTGANAPTAAPASNTSTYIAIGVAVAAAGGLAWYLTRKRSPVHSQRGRLAPSKRLSRRR